MISAGDPHRRRRVTVLGRSMACVETGAGRPVVFLHGNPTSSYLWRNVIPPVAPVARCIAPDLIGMGESDKLPSSDDEAYRYAVHREYLDGLLDALDLGDGVVMVGQDWGSVLAFDWARRHAGRMGGIVHFEAIVTPFSWEEFPENPEDTDSTRRWFERLRSPEGERMILEENMFVETRIPSRTLRRVTEEEMDAYRRPFAEPGEGRRPTLTWARNLPISGEPDDVVATVEANAAWLQETRLPKVFIRGRPGGLIQGPRIDFCRNLPNTREIVVPGVHYIQEDSPDEIGQAVADLVRELDGG